MNVLFVLVSVALLMTKTIISKSIISSHMKPIWETPQSISWILYVRSCHNVKALLHKYYHGWIVLTHVCHVFHFLVVVAAVLLFDMSFILDWFFFLFFILKHYTSGGGWADERKWRRWTLLFYHMNHRWGKEVRDCQHDENLINHNIWSSISKYWIFDLRQKSTVDWQECTAAQTEA